MVERKELAEIRRRAIAEKSAREEQRLMAERAQMIREREAKKVEEVAKPKEPFLGGILKPTATRPGRQVTWTGMGGRPMIPDISQTQNAMASLFGKGDKVWAREDSRAVNIDGILRKGGGLIKGTERLSDQDMEGETRSFFGF